MAAIDKTYTSSWEEYQEIIKWAKENKFTCPNGMIINPLNYCYTWGEEDFKGQRELPVMNTPQSLDYFLIKECPLRIIQRRMKDVYGPEEFQSIKDGTSHYDTFIRPTPGKKLRMVKDSKFHNRKPYSFYNSRVNKKITRVSISVYLGEESLWYNEDYDYFLLEDELGIIQSSGVILRCRSLKAILRRIKKWKLPKGCEVRVRGRYVGEEWIYKVI